MSQEKSLNYKLRVFPDIEEACQVIGLDQETCEAIKTADGFHKT